MKTRKKIGIVLGILALASFFFAPAALGVAMATGVAVTTELELDLFKSKSKEEIAAMSEVEMSTYFMDELKAYAGNIKKAMDEKASDTAVGELKEQYQNVLETQVKLMNDKLKDMGLEISKLKGAEKPSENFKSFKEELRHHLKKNKESLTALKEARMSSQAPKIEFDVKAAGTMTVGANVDVTNGAFPIPMYESGLALTARREPFIAELINTGTIASDTVRWVEQINRDVDAVTQPIAEGAAKQQRDFDLIVREEKVRKIACYIKVSDEMLDDIDFMMSEIQNDLMYEVEIQCDDQILNGDGTGININGILNQSTTYAAGSFANTIDEANNFDVLQTAINQVMVGYFYPTVIVMHPTDVTAMKLTKGTDGHYVLPTMFSADGRQIDGIRIVANTGMTVDNFLVMDGTRSTVYYREGVTLDIGWENDDFTKNLRTVLAEKRLVHRIKTNHYGAFVTGDFTTAKAALETP